MQTLAGIRVLDFGRFVAGPFCATMLADFGADVVRIEKRSGSEDRYVAPIAPTGEGALYYQVNRNKRSLTLDPAHPKAAEIIRRLVKTADIVIANVPADALVTMGLDYPTLCASKPDIILVTASAFGSEGPYRNRLGFDAIGQVMSGAAYMTGEEGAPYRCAAPYVDFGTALSLAFGAMAALFDRQKTGKGQVVESSLLTTALVFNSLNLVEQAALSVDRKPTGNRGQNAAPADIYPTKDGFVMIGVVGMPLFKRWAKLMGESSWLDDPRFKDDLSRGKHGAIISERTRQWTSTLTTSEALAQLAAAHIPAGPVYTPQQAIEDEHVTSTGLFVTPSEAVEGISVPVLRNPVSLSRTDAQLRTQAPVLGLHNAEILAEIGYSPADIEEFAEDGVI